MLIVTYVDSTNYIKLFVRNGNFYTEFVYIKKVNGGSDYGWILIK